MKALKNGIDGNLRNGKIFQMFSCLRWNVKLDSFGVVQKIEELHYDRRIFVNMRPEYEWKNLQEKMKKTFRGLNEYSQRVRVPKMAQKR
jgi:hypothetical protein